MCEALKERYDEKGIGEDIFYDTIGDIVTWTKTWSDLKGELYLGELEWLSNHLKMKLFKLGRLQFCMGKSEYDIPQKGLKKGDNVMEVHIPEGEALTTSECERSFRLAKEFFSKYYPEFEYKHFTCHSWLMDDTLKELLSEDSNIVKFSNMFEHFEKEKDDSILRYVFNWNTTRNNLKNAYAASSFAQKIKKHIADGKDFYSAFGIRDK